LQYRNTSVAQQHSTCRKSSLNYAENYLKLAPNYTENYLEPYPIYVEKTPEKTLDSVRIFKRTTTKPLHLNPLCTGTAPSYREYGHWSSLSFGEKFEYYFVLFLTKIMIFVICYLI